jgi:signal transduction histidine kinase
VENACDLCCAGSAGISLLEEHDGQRYFRWLSVAGEVSALRGKMTAWRDCPCGMALDAHESLLFTDPQQEFPVLWAGPVRVTEGLVVPIETDGAQLGAIWVMSHTDSCRFEREDVRLLSSLATVAGAALTVTSARDARENDSRRRDEFIAMLGHELLGPVAPIDNAVAAAKAQSAGNEHVVQLLTIAQRQIRRLRTVMDELLDAARLQHDKLRLELREASLKGIVSDAILSVEHRLRLRAQTLTVSGLDDDLVVQADDVRLSQVVGNLLSNSVRYSPEGGHIELRITTDLPSKTVIIAVRDNGSGIAMKDLPRLFDLFVQSHDAAGNGGLGVGLAVVKRLVELHDGTVEVTSQGPGKGTEVTARLPILCETLSYQADRSEAAPPGRPLQILLVDDDDDALGALSAMLICEGHSVDMADSGGAALLQLEHVKPELAIVDLDMPGMDGFDVARAIRADASCQDIYLVALSGYVEDGYRCQAFTAGFDAYVTKPLSLDAFKKLFADHGFLHRQLRA